MLLNATSQKEILRLMLWKRHPQRETYDGSQALHSDNKVKVGDSPSSWLMMLWIKSVSGKFLSSTRGKSGKWKMVGSIKHGVSEMICFVIFFIGKSPIVVVLEKYWAEWVLNFYWIYKMRRMESFIDVSNRGDQGTWWKLIDFPTSSFWFIKHHWERIPEWFIMLLKLRKQEDGKWQERQMKPTTHLVSLGSRFMCSAMRNLFILERLVAQFVERRRDLGDENLAPTMSSEFIFMNRLMCFSHGGKLKNGKMEKFPRHPTELFLGDTNEQQTS
jgi:hypothetical protein